MILASCPLAGRSGHDAAWALLEQVYRQETGQPLPEIRRTRAGKPCFLQGPYHFSLSHTKSHAFCVLAKENVAVDAEELDRPVNLKLAQRILSPSELAQFQQAPDKKRALLTFWVLKEAAVKLSGTGLQGFPNRTHFSLTDPRVICREGCLVAVFRQSDSNPTGEHNDAV